jgi:hypothetical protein
MKKGSLFLVVWYIAMCSSYCAQASLATKNASPAHTFWGGVNAWQAVHGAFILIGGYALYTLHQTVKKQEFCICSLYQQLKHVEKKSKNEMP